MSKVNAPKWQGRDIVKDEDANDLEQRAALYEFKHRMNRGDAEHRAHHEYRQDKHREAAAYHLQGLKAAQAAGSQEEGHKHGLMYQLHMKALGLDPMGPVPNEIKSLAEKQDKFYKFRPHRGDVFLLQNSTEKAEPELAKADKVIPFPQKPQQVPKSWDQAVQETAAAGPQKEGNVTNIATKLNARRQARRANVEQTLNSALETMASDPGLQAEARKRDVEAKAAKLKSGPAMFKPGQQVLHVDQESYPWTGIVRSHNYRDNDIDGPGHYYEVQWWNPKLKQYHDDYLHQDNLRPKG